MANHVDGCERGEEVVPRSSAERPALSPARGPHVGAVGLSGRALASELGEQRGFILKQLGVTADRYGAVPYLVEVWFDLLLDTLRERGETVVCRPDAEWTVLASARRRDGDIVPESIPPGLSRLKRRRGRDTVPESDPPDRRHLPPVTASVGLSDRRRAVLSFVTPGVRGPEGSTPYSGLRVDVTVGDVPVSITRVATDGPSPTDRRLALARADLETRAEAERWAAEWAATWRARGLVKFGNVIELSARKYGATFTRVVVYAVLLGATALAALTVRYVWVRYHVRPTPSQERYVPLPAEEWPRDPATSLIPIVGDGWGGVVEVRPRGDGAFLFTFVPTTLPAFASAAPPGQGVRFAWRFDGGGGFSPYAETNTPQILYRFPSPPTHFVLQLELRGVDINHVYVPVAPGGAAAVSIGSDAAGKPLFTIDTAVPEGQPIPGATVVPVAPTAVPPAPTPAP